MRETACFQVRSSDVLTINSSFLILHSSFISVSLPAFSKTNDAIMNETDAALRRREIYKVTLAGSVVNIVLTLCKFAAGILGRSAAMVADAVHSLSDLATDVIVLVFVRISGKPEDKGHDYGHGKYETFATLLIGVALLVVGIGILWIVKGLPLASVSRLSTW